MSDNSGYLARKLAGLARVACVTIGQQPAMLARCIADNERALSRIRAILSASDTGDIKEAIDAAYSKQAELSSRRPWPPPHWSDLANVAYEALCAGKTAEEAKLQVAQSTELYALRCELRAVGVI